MVFFRRAILSLSSSSSSSFPLQISIGILAASYWRGSWYVLDHILYPNERLKSGLASLLSGAALLGMQQHILSPAYNGTKQLVRLLPPPPSSSINLRRKYIQANRFLLLYGIATSCVLLWRGTWLLWDEAAHWMADSIEDFQNNGKICAEDVEISEETAWKSSLTPMVPKTKTTHDTAVAGDATATTITSSATQVQQQSLHLSTLSSSTHTSNMDTVTNTTEGISSFIPYQQLSTLHNHHHEHEDHHGESSVTQHADITDKTLFYSGIASHVVATVILLFMGRFVSVMAPPANSTLLKDHFLHERGKKFAKAARKFVEQPKE